MDEVITYEKDWTEMSCCAEKGVAGLFQKNPECQKCEISTAKAAKRGLSAEGAVQRCRTNIFRAIFVKTKLFFPICVKI